MAQARGTLSRWTASTTGPSAVAVKREITRSFRTPRVRYSRYSAPAQAATVTTICATVRGRGPRPVSISMPRRGGGGQGPPPPPPAPGRGAPALGPPPPARGRGVGDPDLVRHADDAVQAGGVLVGRFALELVADVALERAPAV